MLKRKPGKYALLRRRIERLERAARELLTAYARSESAGDGGGVEWEDIDGAFEAAREALPMEYEYILAQMERERAEQCNA